MVGVPFSLFRLHFCLLLAADSSAAHESGQGKANAGGNNDEAAQRAINAAEARAAGIEANKLRFRNLKIFFNVAFVLINGLLVSGYIALAFNIGKSTAGC